ncbi:MAG: hypothetical protein V4510_09865 [bacterium]
MGYLALLGDNDFLVVGAVLDVIQDGLPGFPHPVIKVEGKAGYVNASHCVRLAKEA